MTAPRAKDKARVLRWLDRAHLAAVNAEQLARAYDLPPHIATRIGSLWYEADTIRAAIEEVETRGRPRG